MAMTLKCLQVSLTGVTIEMFVSFAYALRNRLHSEKLHGRMLMRTKVVKVYLQ